MPPAGFGFFWQIAKPELCFFDYFSYSSPFQCHTAPVLYPQHISICFRTDRVKGFFFVTAAGTFIMLRQIRKLAGLAVHLAHAEGR